MSVAMDLDLLKTFGQIAAPAGLAIGACPGYPPRPIPHGGGMGVLRRSLAGGRHERSAPALVSEDGDRRSDPKYSQDRHQQDGDRGEGDEEG